MCCCNFVLIPHDCVPPKDLFCEGVAFYFLNIGTINLSVKVFFTIYV